MKLHGLLDFTSIQPKGGLTVCAKGDNTQNQRGAEHAADQRTINAASDGLNELNSRFKLPFDVFIQSF